MALIGWVETTSDLEDWADAPVDEDVLARYMGAAHEQCVDFLPHITASVTDPVTGEVTDTFEPVIPAPIPGRFVLAQIMQARALYRSMLAGSGDGIGADGLLSVTVFPMDWTVKNLLRPRTVGRVL